MIMKKITAHRKQGTRGQRMLTIIDITQAAKAEGLMVPVWMTKALWKEVNRVEAWCEGWDAYEVGPDPVEALLRAWFRGERETINRFTILYHLEVSYFGSDEIVTPMTVKSVASRDEEGNFSLTLM